MPRLSNDENNGRKELRAQDNPSLNPDDGIYSGASKRVAYSDGTFAPIDYGKKNSRKS